MNEPTETSGDPQIGQPTRRPGNPAEGTVARTNMESARRVIEDGLDAIIPG